eukprot:2066862-Amphidinium_carterae.1
MMSSSVLSRRCWKHPAKQYSCGNSRYKAEHSCRNTSQHSVDAESLRNTADGMRNEYGNRPAQLEGCHAPFAKASQRWWGAMHAKQIKLYLKPATT